MTLLIDILQVVGSIFLVFYVILLVLMHLAMMTPLDGRRFDPDPLAYDIVKWTWLWPVLAPYELYKWLPGEIKRYVGVRLHAVKTFYKEAYLHWRKT